MTDKPTSWWHNVKDTNWLLLSKAGTLGDVYERNNDPHGDLWEWAVFEKPHARGVAHSGEQARAAVSRELARRKEGK